MINTDYFRGKRVVVVGLARSGIACANLLYDLGASISVTDNQDNTLTRRNSARLKSDKIRLELGKHSLEFIRGSDLMVLSPGVPGNASPVVLAGQLKIPVISEIEFAWRLCPGEVIAVTGTNGKTTVTTLIGKILEASGKKSFVCGNIGNPFSGEVEKISPGDFVALEVSSFQLERIDTFRPKISLILNLSRNHLDRYNDMQDYLDAKKRIFLNQDKNDYLILNRDDPVVSGLASEAKANVIYFSAEDGLNPNQAAVLAVGNILDIDKEIILEVFGEFRGVEHRLEYVAEKDKVKFINDSKATTVDAAIWALNNIREPLVLIAGGREKGNDYGLIRKLIIDKARELVLIGEAREKLEGFFKGSIPINNAATMQEAVRIAFLKAKPGDCVLLSPMCKSFDMFSDYEERGRVFKESVLNLIKAKN